MRLWQPKKPREDLLDRDRKITSTNPLFDLAAIQGWVKSSAIRILRNAESDVEELEWSEDEIAELLRALHKSDYIGSEWCQVGHGTNWVIDCDVYIAGVNSDFQRDPSSPRYYLKFSIRGNEACLVVVRCHLERGL